MHAIAALFTILQEWKQHECPSFISKSVTCIKYYSALKRKEIVRYITTQMNLENTMISKINQSHKDKYSMIPHIMYLE